MNNLQSEIINTLNVQSKINPKEELRKRIDFLKEYCKKTNSSGYVLGISGGQDSTLAGKLAQIAVNELREEGFFATFTAIRLPYGIQKDEDDAQLAIRFINPDETVIFNIKPTVHTFSLDYEHETKKSLQDFHKGNVKARTRMMVQYAFAGEHNLLVLGTDHAAESVTGFFTKYGDGGADTLPLSGLTKRQGEQLLKYLNSPEKLYSKIPTADLLDDKTYQSDEDELGITYDEIDDYLEGKNVNKTISNIIEKRYLSTKHKRNLPVALSDKWWK